MNPLTEGIDYYVNESGLFVFTEKYHLDRGYCCRSGCKHCPYEFDKNEKKNSVRESPAGKKINNPEFQQKKF